MLAELLPFLQKLWDKGIDIGAAVIASTISAGIVAGIATAAWRWNKRRDLRHEDAKQRQQHRIAEELAEQTRRTEDRARHQRLSAQRATFADAMAKPIRQVEAAELWDQYLTWCRTDQLDLLPRNLSVLNGYSQMSSGLRGMDDLNFASAKAQLVKVIRETDLPEPLRVIDGMTE
jgi:hypothetical protein